MWGVGMGMRTAHKLLLKYHFYTAPRSSLHPFTLATLPHHRQLDDASAPILLHPLRDGQGKPIPRVHRKGRGVGHVRRALIRRSRPRPCAHKRNMPARPPPLPAGRGKQHSQPVWALSQPGVGSLELGRPRRGAASFWPGSRSAERLQRPRLGNSVT